MTTDVLIHADIKCQFCNIFCLGQISLLESIFSHVVVTTYIINRINYKCSSIFQIKIRNRIWAINSLKQLWISNMIQFEGPHEFRKEDACQPSPMLSSINFNVSVVSCQHDTAIAIIEIMLRHCFDLLCVIYFNVYLNLFTSTSWHTLIW